MGAFGGSKPEADHSNLNFAEPAMKEVVSDSTKGQNGKNGLLVRAAFTIAGTGANRYLALRLEMENHSGTLVKDFDIMFNKNPFGIGIYGMANEF